MALMWQHKTALPLKFLGQTSCHTVVIQVDMYMLTSLQTGLEANHIQVLSYLFLAC